MRMECAWGIGWGEGKDGIGSSVEDQNGCDSGIASGMNAFRAQYGEPDGQSSQYGAET